MFDLAGHLGMTVERMLNEMSSAEFTYWIAKYRKNPWGNLENDLLNATQLRYLDLIMQTTGIRNAKPKKLEDMLVFQSRGKERSSGQTPEEMYYAFIGATGQMPRGKK